jgi:hypothetical protein
MALRMEEGGTDAQLLHEATLDKAVQVDYYESENWSEVGVCLTRDSVGMSD